MLGNTIAHYHITALLGRGGMGEVYQARDTKLGRDVAIKVIPSGIEDSRSLLIRLQREAQALAALNHPHIATIHTCDMDHEVPFIVLELVKGRTLAEHLEEHPLSMGETVHIAQQIAKAVHAAHESGIIHRDLKPGNIKLTLDGDVKVLDFGLARITNTEHNLSTSTTSREPDHESTTPGTVIGTPAYMSPEQARGGNVDKRADIWAFGCCLYEMLTWHRPFTGQTAADLMAEIMKSDPDWNRIPEETPSEIRTILRLCLEKSPNHRISHLGDVAMTLNETSRSVDAHEARSKKGPTAPATLSPRDSLYWILCFFALVLGMILAAVLLPSNDLEPAPKQIKSLAVVPFQNITNAEDTADLITGLTGDLITVLQPINGLRVQGPMSSLRFKDSTSLPKEIGSALNVEHLLTGSISQENDRIRINANLIEAATGFSLWSTNYDRPFANLLDIRSDVAGQVARALEIRLGVSEATSLKRTPTTSPNAYALYLKGRAYWNRRTKPDFQRAIEYFESALESDPEYARAYAGIADTHTLWSIYSVADLSDRPEQAVAMANRARELDPSLADPYATIGFAKFLYDRDWEGAEKAFQAASKLNPNYAQAHAWYSVMLICQGRAEEGLREAELAESLDPAPNNRVIRALALLHLNRIPEARKYLQEQIANDPWFGNYHLFHVQAQVMNGNLQEALEAVEEMRTAQIAPERVIENEAWVLALLGRHPEARQRLKQLQALDQNGNDHSAFSAQIMLALGDETGALTQLRSVINDGDNLFPFLYRQIDWKSLHEDQRYQSILTQLNLP